MNEIVLKINDVEYNGWKSLQVDLSMNQMAGAFGFTATDLFPGQFDKWQVKMGDECTIVLNEHVLINGFVDQINIGYDAASHNIQISGRDKTADLVDCSFAGNINEWKKLTVESIINRLCKLHFIEVVVDSSVITEAKEIKESFKINQGETIAESILELCRPKGILPITFGDGKLTLTRAGVTKAVDSFVVGQNIKAGNFDQNNMDRFSNYIVKAQGSGNDNLILTDYVQPTGELEDAVILRYRPIVILFDGKVDNAGAKNLARWEARNRAGQSRVLNYIVQGWLQKDGTPWQINKIVEVNDSILGIKKEYLIAGVSFTLSETGSETSVILVHPDTYKLKPQVVDIKGPSDTGFDPTTQVSQ